MPSLTDHIDSLTRNTKNITATAGHATSRPSDAGPFTAAILHSHLGDLIRDVDPSELGLFSLVQPKRQQKPQEIERINFHGATPLRRNNPRPDDVSRIRDLDPELYAEAALKYMDRYKLVRPMPRAQAQVQAILKRILFLKQSIDDLTDTLHQLEETRSSTVPDLKIQLEEEERRIRDLRAKLSELTDQRLTLLKAKKSHLDLMENKSVTRRPIVSSKPHAEEDKFWNTPAVSARTFKLTSNNLLMDEKADFSDVGSISFSASPVVAKAASNIFTDAILDSSPQNSGLRLFQSPDTLSNKKTNTEWARFENLSSSPGRDVLHNSAMGEAIDSTISEPSRIESDGVEITATDQASGIVITNTVELIAGKIWAAMSDLVILAAAVKNVYLRDKPPTRDLICYLEHVQDVIPSDDLATVATSNAPTLPQVLTATLLVGLLSSSADHSLPLTKVKDLLAARTDGTSNPSQPNSSRIVYGCVAKRLLKIDRSGGEQIVKFDV